MKCAQCGHEMTYYKHFPPPALHPLDANPICEYVCNNCGAELRLAAGGGSSDTATIKIETTSATEPEKPARKILSNKR